MEEIHEIIERLGNLAGGIWGECLGSRLVESDALETYVLEELRKALEILIKRAVAERGSSYEQLVDKLNSHSRFHVNLQDDNELERKKQDEITGLEGKIRLIERMSNNKTKHCYEGTLEQCHKSLNYLHQVSKDEWREKLSGNKELIELIEYVHKWLLSFVLSEEEKEDLRQEIVDWYIHRYSDGGSIKNVKGDDLLFQLLSNCSFEVVGAPKW